MGINFENKKLCFDTPMLPTATKSKIAIFSNLICIISREFHIPNVKWITEKIAEKSPEIFKVNVSKGQ